MTEKATIYYMLQHYKSFVLVDGDICLVDQSNGKLIRCTPEFAKLMMFCLPPRSIDEILTYMQDLDSSISINYVTKTIETLVAGDFLTDNIADFEKPPIHSLPIHGSKLVSLTVLPTLKCNQSCSYCYNRNADIDDMPLENWLPIFKEINNNSDITTLTISGGEPLLRPDVINLIDKQSYSTSLLGTNGQILTEELIPLVKNKFHHVSLSVDSMDPSHHNNARGESTHEKVIHAAKLLSQSGISWHGNMVITNDNISEMGAVRKFVKELGGERLSTSMEICNNMLDPNTYLDLLKQTEFRWDSDRYPITKSNLCGLGKSTAAIGPDGAIYPCHFFALSKFQGFKVHETGLKAAWKNSPSLRKIREIDFNNIDKCRSCSYFGLCKGGCRGIAYYRSGSITGHIGPQACMMFKYQYDNKIRQMRREQ